MRHLSTEESKAILEAGRVGVLSMAKDASSYAIPLFYAFDGENVYFHCHPGMKDDFIDATQEACLVAIHMDSENVWESVQVFGKLERLSLSTDIDAAKNALYHVPFPPAEGNFPGGVPKRTDVQIFYMAIRPSRIEGVGSAFVEPSSD